MSAPGATAVARARELVGVRFRLHGRDPASGLDCVGVAAAALGLDGVPSGYALRGTGLARVEAAIGARLARVTGERVAGDLLLMETGPGQLHLGIWTGDGLVHADLSLGRVAERPEAVGWPVLAAWRGRG